ncbi:MAG: hypothetical protein DCF15_05360 [Phormidesmis priestleyi]|uniref:Uncharacterized protein n=1 Tax=Phormidesmis priestleyi TaxID=268141 RepID=A0A2W4XNK3_9CYAN|nr:MAG: hypothetical protein DCF15_05360 [Phormidesmis priestleyi]
MKSLGEETQVVLESLKRTAAKTLERKRRLGHYAVVWRDGKPVAIGEDAPDAQGETPKGDRTYCSADA